MASPATLVVVKCTGVDASVETTVSGFAFKSVDDANGSPYENLDAPNHPVEVPEAGTNYSYEVWLRLKALTTPDTQITNIKWWGKSTTIASGYRTTIGTVSSGVTPVNMQSVQGTRLVQHIDNTVSNKLDVAGVIDNLGTNVYSDFVVLQGEVDATIEDSGVGSKTGITQYYSYQEN